MTGLVSDDQASRCKPRCCPASALSRSAAICGAGTAMPLRPMRPRPPPCGCRSATGLPRSKSRLHKPRKPAPQRSRAYSEAKTLADQTREIARSAEQNRTPRRAGIDRSPGSRGRSCARCRRARIAAGHLRSGNPPSRSGARCGARSRSTSDCRARRTRRRRGADRIRSRRPQRRGRRARAHMRKRARRSMRSVAKAKSARSASPPSPDETTRWQSRRDAAAPADRGTQSPPRRNARRA